MSKAKHRNLPICLECGSSNFQFIIDDVVFEISDTETRVYHDIPHFVCADCKKATFSVESMKEFERQDKERKETRKAG